MTSIRPERLAQFIKKEVADILLRKMNDNRIGFISLTDVELSPDFRYAKILYSQIGNDAEKKKTAKALNRAASFIKFELGKVLQIRVVPNLRFVFDDSLERGVNLVTKINHLNDNE
jgi:ribosome-binding factor A